MANIPNVCFIFDITEEETQYAVNDSRHVQEVLVGSGATSMGLWGKAVHKHVERVHVQLQFTT